MGTCSFRLVRAEIIEHFIIIHMAKQDSKWHEDLLWGTLSAITGITMLFNGFTRMTQSFVQDGEIVGGPTKQKGIIALVSLIESSWWKYIIIGLLLLFAYILIKKGIEKFKLRKQ